MTKVICQLHSSSAENVSNSKSKLGLPLEYKATKKIKRDSGCFKQLYVKKDRTAQCKYNLCSEAKCKSKPPLCTSAAQVELFRK